MTKTLFSVSGTTHLSFYKTFTRSNTVYSLPFLSTCCTVSVFLPQSAICKLPSPTPSASEKFSILSVLTQTVFSVNHVNFYLSCLQPEIYFAENKIIN